MILSVTGLVFVHPKLKKESEFCGAKICKELPRLIRSCQKMSDPMIESPCFIVSSSVFIVDEFPIYFPAENVLRSHGLGDISGGGVAPSVLGH